MRRSGFTLIEVLTVITITTIVAAILYPVLEMAKRRSSEAVCVSNLHQLEMAIELYRTAYSEEKTDFGLPSDMGLPPWFPKLEQVGLVSLSLLLSCRGQGLPAGTPAVYTQAWPPPREDIGNDSWQQLLAKWLPYVQAHGSASVLLEDRNHMYIRTESPFATERGIGVYIDGHVKTITRQGDTDLLEWWN